MTDATVFFEKYQEILTTQNLQPRRAYLDAEAWWIGKKQRKKFGSYASFKASISRWRRHQKLKRLASRRGVVR